MRLWCGFCAGFRVIGCHGVRVTGCQGDRVTGCQGTIDFNMNFLNHFLIDLLVDFVMAFGAPKWGGSSKALLGNLSM